MISDMAFVESISKIGESWSVLTLQERELFKRAPLSHMVGFSESPSEGKLPSQESSLVVNIQAPSPSEHGFVVDVKCIVID